MSLTLELISYAMTSTTGSNLRNILLRTSKLTIHELVPKDALSVDYHPIANSDKWRVKFISEIIQTKHKQLNISNIPEEDLEEMLIFLWSCHRWCVGPCMALITSHWSGGGQGRSIAYSE